MKQTVKQSTETMETALVWLRRDLRFQDQKVLADATAHAKQVHLIYVDEGNLNTRQQKFVQERLKAMGVECACGRPSEVILERARSLRAQAVWVGEEYEPQAKKRDEAVRLALAGAGIAWHAVKEHVIFAGSEIKNGQGEPYRVFTAFKKAWLARLKASDLRDAVVREERIVGRVPKLENPLDEFRGRIRPYTRERDFPAQEGTSRLGVHLRFGTVSIRECVRAALEEEGRGSVWLSELIWREFFQMILDQYPHVESGAFRKEYDSIRWPGREEDFEAWKAGRTGFPLVDAAMRCLAETGWMHNRLRMIVASFLVKDLHVDWRRGERYFAEQLLDYDLAANNGGWQWCASTGCDAQPYFRIFHPELQKKKFDPDGVFIRKWIPQTEMPIPPIVDHAESRLLALRLFQKARSVTS